MPVSTLSGVALALPNFPTTATNSPVLTAKLASINAGKSPNMMSPLNLDGQGASCECPTLHHLHHSKRPTFRSTYANLRTSKRSCFH